MKRIAILALVTATLVQQAQAEVVTSVKKISSGFGSFREFSTEQTPCFIRPIGWNPTDIPHLRKLFVEAGMNVVDDKKAPCQVIADGFVTMSNGDGKPVTPIRAEFLLQNQDKVADVGPALSVAGDADNTASKASGISPLIGAADIDALSRVGNVLGGSSGSIAAVAIGVLVDITVGVAARNKTPAGVAHIKVEAAFGGFLPAALGLDVYAGATTKENPAVLIKAAVDRYVKELKQQEMKDKGGAAQETASPQTGEGNAQ